MARDPNRIDRMLMHLAFYWHRYPDLRLGQLIGNMSAKIPVDPYYIEDEALLQKVLNELEDLEAEEEDDESCY